MVELHLPEHLDVNRFLSVQAHDLKTPFNHIIGFARIMLSGQDGPLTDFQREDLTTIYHSGARVLGWISAIIEAARLQGSEKEPHPSNADLHRLVEEALNQWKRSNPHRSFEFEVRCASSSPLCRLDDFQVRQAVAGLISYVAEFVTQTAKITLFISEEDGNLLLTVRSTGRKNPRPSSLDVELYGYLARTYLEQNGGQLYLLRENEDGVTVQFLFPKSG